MNLIALSVQNSCKSFFRFASKAVLVSAVFLFVIAVFLRLAPSGEPINTISAEDVYKQEFIKKLSTIDKLSPEDRAATRLQKLSYCRLTGDFCHADPHKITKEDIKNSASTKVADVFMFPLVNLPPSGIQTTLNTLAQSGVIPKTYAASGVGLGGVSGYAHVWMQMRNVAFLVLVLVIISAGFVIMFNSQISANTAMKIESVLPKIIITMILIQFSLTIVGFLIDLMYVSSALVIAVLGPLAAPTTSFTDLMNKYVYGSPQSLLTALTGPGGLWGNLYKLLYEIPDKIMSILGWQMRYVFRAAIAIIGLIALVPKTNINTGDLAEIGKELINLKTASGAGAKALSGASVILLVLLLLLKAFPIIVFLILPQIAIGIILIAAIVFAAWKILKMIVVSYISIILLTIFAPLILLMDVLPGKKGFSGWLKNVMRELSTFPILIAVILISYLILSVQMASISLKLPFMLFVDSQAFAYIVGIALLAMSPKLVEDFRTALFGSPSNLGGGAKEALLQGIPWILKLPDWVPGSKSAKAVADRLNYDGRSKEQKRMEEVRKIFNP